MSSLNLLMRQNVRGYQLRNGVEALAHHLCQSLGLQPVVIKWTGNISTAAMSASGDMFLASIADDAKVDRKLIVRYVGFVIHELLHRRYTDFKVNGNSQYLRSLHNAIEDVWIERRGIQSGITGNIAQVLHLLVEDIAGQAMHQVYNWADPAQYPFIIAINGRKYGNITVPCPGNLKWIFDEAANRVDACQSTTDTLAVATWVLSELRKDQPDQPEEQQQPQPGNPGKDAGQDAGQDGAPDASESPTGGDQGEDGTQGTGAGSGDPGEDGEDGDSGSPGGTGAGGKDAGHGPKVDGDPKTLETEPTVKLHKSQIGRDWSNVRTFRDPDYHIRNMGGVLQNRASARMRFEVRKLLDNTGTEDYSSNKRNGRLNVKVLHRAVTHDNRIFDKRTETAGVETAVILCVDCSGSMTGASIQNAAMAASALIDTLDAAGAAWSIQTFDDQQSLPCDWNTSKAKAIKKMAGMCANGGTNDYVAVRMAHDRLLKRPESRKIVMVISDGDGNNWEWTRDQVKAGRNIGITSIGIGIGHNVAHIYGKDSCIRVDNSADLANAAFSQLKVVR